MKTPEESWEEYRDFVYSMELPEGDENERKRAFFAGAESVFKLMETLDGMSMKVMFASLQRYRDANARAATETIPPEDRLIEEIERKSALGEIE